MFKFPKTRNGVSSHLLQESYAMQFWNKIQPDLDRISNINDMLEESDLVSCRDLYRKLK